jgi:hypothetical protein
MSTSALAQATLALAQATSTLAQVTLANHAARADYEIHIDLLHGDDVVPHIPRILKLGKTVHYTSSAGVVEIEFTNGSPYLNPDGSPKREVYSYEPPIELRVGGTFMGLCYITAPDGVRYPAVSSNYSPVGGNHVVQ